MSFEDDYDPKVLSHYKNLIELEELDKEQNFD